LGRKAGVVETERCYDGSNLVSENWKNIEKKIYKD
jgi:hypothetical protein